MRLPRSPSRPQRSRRRRPKTPAPGPPQPGPPPRLCSKEPDGWSGGAGPLSPRSLTRTGLAHRQSRGTPNREMFYRKSVFVVQKMHPSRHRGRNLDLRGLFIPISQVCPVCILNFKLEVPGSLPGLGAGFPSPNPRLPLENRNPGLESEHRNDLVFGRINRRRALRGLSRVAGSVAATEVRRPGPSGAGRAAGGGVNRAVGGASCGAGC